MYFFECKAKKYCVDATAETNRLGRLFNHSSKFNCRTKVFVVDSKPHLILMASRDIQKGEEMTFDYGDRKNSSIESFPWLKK